MLEKYVLTILELNWNQILGHKRTKLNICHHMLCSRRPLNSKTVMPRRRKNENVSKMSKDEKCTCKACKNTVFHWLFHNEAFKSLLRPKPPLCCWEWICGAFMSWISRFVITKVVFAVYCTRTWIPLTAIHPTPVGIRMHVLIVPLYQHRFAICAVDTTHWDIFVPLALVFVNKS